MTDEFWLTCCQCGKRFAIAGQLARDARAFYAAQPGHTPDKEGGVCDECFEKGREQQRELEAQSMVARRRWFRFSLRALFVAVAICGIGGYWLAQWVAAERASQEYDRAYAAWRAEMLMMSDVCQASLELFHAQAGVPFADKAKAAAAHLERVARLNELAIEGPGFDYDIGDSARADVARYYAEAQRLAAEN